MLLNIVKAKANEGQEVDFDCEVKLDDKFLEDRNCEILTPATVKGKMVFNSGKLEVKAVVSFKVLAVCDKCCEKFEKVISFPLEEIFVDGAKAHNEEDYVILNQTCVDIDKPVQDSLLLSLPTRMICREDCKGLCMVCGKNKNFYECACEDIVKEEEDKENPFNALKNKK